MSLLDSPRALELLEEAVVPIEVVSRCQGRLSAFLHRYLPRFYRDEQRELASVVVEGKLSGLERKTAEPIARQAQRHRKPVQHFVGAGCWDDEAVLLELRRHVTETIADADGVLIVDSSAFAKKGDESCGVKRQWNGRLGKVDNCQVGVYVGYAGRRGHTLLDQRLYLPEEWAADQARREKCHVPNEVVFATQWQMGLDLLERCQDVPHGWVVGDDSFGRVTAFRQTLRRRGQHYVLDVPCNTLIRELQLTPEGRRPPFEQVEQWAARQPSSRWRRVVIRAGERGALVVRTLSALVQTKDEEGRVGRAERVLVLRPVNQAGDVSYALSDVGPEVPVATLARMKSQRHGIEEMFQEAKGEVGLGQYEVRSWVGWHHHMTLSALALWFLCLERHSWGEKGVGPNGAATPAHHDSATGTRADASADRRRDQRHRTAQ
jgi:SRSO17 transposase